MRNSQETAGKYRRRLHCCCAAIVVLLAGLAGCASGRGGATAPRSWRDRDSRTAEQLTAKGLEAVESGNLDDAERHLHAAITSDPGSASAHNNLGLVLLRQGRHYDAAWEFEYASSLAPHAAEPRANLGLLYEELGRLDDAQGQYDAALKIDPNHLASMQNLSRVYVKTDARGDELKELLERILLISDDEHWDYWVRGQLIRLGRND